MMVGLISTLAMNNQANAQTGPEEVTAYSINTPGKESSTKNINILLESEVHPKAIKDFHKNFKDFEPTWLKTTSKGYAATFKTAENYFILFYDKKGNWTYSCNQYKEEKMDKEIRKMVRQKYYDFKILIVYEIKTSVYNSKPTYIVLIKDDSYYKWIRIQSGNMDVYKNLEIAK